MGRSKKRKKLNYFMLHSELVSLIDTAVSRDFIIHEITPEDMKNDSYKGLKFSLDFNKISIQYQRKVESEKYPVIPRFQYLFGFIPRDGLCVFVKKKEHKIALCEGPLDEINKSCSLIHSLMYLLVPSDRFEVYSYIPGCCEIKCPNSPKQYELRINLFEELKE
ncbi:MAG: hypothetical protein P8Y70_03100 [Candidatus Lokiarchaeota archaeon]